MGRGQGHSSTDVNQVRRPFRDRARLWAGPTGMCQVGGRRRGHPEHGQQRRKWAKVNSKIINKGEGRGEEEYILIYRLYTESMCL